MLCNFRVKSAMDPNEPVGNDHTINGRHPEDVERMSNHENEDMNRNGRNDLGNASSNNNDGNSSNNNGSSREVMGSAHMRPVFLGNLIHDVHASDIADIFERPLSNDVGNCVAVERIDLKRGFCFVFLKPAMTQADKDNAERYVSEINGMYVHKPSFCPTAHPALFPRRYPKIST